MQKELSLTICNILFKQNRVKAADLKDGEEVLYFEDGKLCHGTVVRCDSCPNIGTINAGMVDARCNREEDLIAFKFVHSTRFQGADSIGCYDADGSGAVLCYPCQQIRDDRYREAAEQAVLDHQIATMQSEGGAV